MRGAPAIAITGALALAVELQLQGSGSQFSSAQAANQWIEEKLDYLVTRSHAPHSQKLVIVHCHEICLI